MHPALRGLRAVLFDAGGTLVHPDWERLARLALEQTGRAFSAIELERAMRAGIHAAAERTMRGDAPLADEQQRNWVFRRMYATLGLDSEVCATLGSCLDTEHDARHLWAGLDPDASRVVSELKRRGFRIGVISNTEDGRLEELLETVEIASQFELLIDSHVVNLRKPDAAIFQLALKKLGVAASEAAYVGDSYVHDALAAKGAGLHALLLDAADMHPESVCPRIRSLGELIDWPAWKPRAPFEFAPHGL